MASFGGSIVALFIFSTAVASEIRKGTIRLTLSKPVSRTQFLLGKYLGGVVVMAAFALLTSLAILLFAQTQNMELSPVIKWAPWLMFCRQLMLGSLAMLLSLFMHPSSPRCWPSLLAMAFIHCTIPSVSGGANM